MLFGNLAIDLASIVPDDLRVMHKRIESNERLLLFENTVQDLSHRQNYRCPKMLPKNVTLGKPIAAH